MIVDTLDQQDVTDSPDPYKSLEVTETMFPLRDMIHREAARRVMITSSNPNDDSKLKAVEPVEFYPEIEQPETQHGPPLHESPRSYRIAIPTSRRKVLSGYADPISEAWVTEARAAELFDM